MKGGESAGVWKGQNHVDLNTGTECFRNSYAEALSSDKAHFSKHFQTLETGFLGGTDSLLFRDYILCYSMYFIAFTYIY